MTNAHPQLQVADQRKMDRLVELAQRAVKIGQGAPLERVAVPNPKGGYRMEVRPVRAAKAR